MIVCEAFSGNIVLKMYEGTAKALLGEIKGALMGSLQGKIGGLLIKGPLKKTLKKFDATEYGGAPLLGLNGLVVKIHGSSKHKEVTNAIVQCLTFKEEKINDRIKEKIC